MGPRLVPCLSQFLSEFPCVDHFAVPTRSGGPRPPTREWVIGKSGDTAILQCFSEPVPKFFVFDLFRLLLRSLVGTRGGEDYTRCLHSHTEAVTPSS